MSNLRFKVLQEAFAKKAVAVQPPASMVSDYYGSVLPYFDVIRYHVDKLELIVDDELWPLPKYREILFSH